MFPGFPDPLLSEIPVAWLSMRFGKAEEHTGAGAGAKPREDLDEALKENWGIGWNYEL